MCNLFVWLLTESLSEIFAKLIAASAAIAAALLTVFAWGLIDRRNDWLIDGAECVGNSCALLTHSS